MCLFTCRQNMNELKTESQEEKKKLSRKKHNEKEESERGNVLSFKRQTSKQFAIEANLMLAKNIKKKTAQTNGTKKGTQIKDLMSINS